MAPGVQNPLGVGIIGTGFGLMHLLGYRACDNVQVVAERQADPNIPLLWRHRKETAGFGVLGDIGPHVIDILRWILGDFRKVSAHCLTAISERKVAGSGEVVAADAEDACAFVAEMASG